MTFPLPEREPCPFCEYLAGTQPCAFVTRGELVSAFMNRAQFERGATLLVPNVHVEHLLALDADLMLAIYAEAQRLARGMIRAYGAVGLNMFQNNGVRAGQEIPHFHVHLVPRYESGDPGRLFRSDDCPRTPVDELERVARKLRAALREP